MTAKLLFTIGLPFISEKKGFYAIIIFLEYPNNMGFEYNFGE